MIIENEYRSHYCGKLDTTNVGEEVKLSGWMHSIRDHGGLVFIDLRDHTGLLQIVFDPEKQNIFNLLDSSPKLLTAKAHRPAYGSDGDYFSKPSEDDVFEAAYEIMNEHDPIKYPIISSK